MSKTGYEIRADILHLAKEYMDKQSALYMEYSKKMIDAGNQNMSELAKNYIPNYSIEDMIKIAERMYSFVNEKKN